MVYTSPDRVLEEAGLVGIETITEGKVQSLIDEAHTVLRGTIASRYVLTAFDTNFAGSDGETLLGRIETLLAAGYLLQQEYPQEDGDNAEGDMRVKRAMDMLAQISDGSLRLIDSNGTQFTTNGSTRSGTSIDATFPAPDDEDLPASFSLGQVF